MSTILPINLDALLHCRGVESERVEFKASWDPGTTGVQVLRTICAFANDYHNLNDTAGRGESLRARSTGCGRRF